MYNLMERGTLRWHEIPGMRGRWFKREDLDGLRQPPRLADDPGHSRDVSGSTVV
jgi:hypothetical protein